VSLFLNNAVFVSAICRLVESKEKFFQLDAETKGDVKNTLGVKVISWETQRET
jgi:hypothetical protein